MNYWLKSIHFLAFYAYRAFLANVFGIVSFGNILILNS